MKLSKGSPIEFIFALFFILVGFNIEDSTTSLIVIVCGIAVCIHCIYLWIQKGKENRGKKDDNNNNK